MTCLSHKSRCISTNASAKWLPPYDFAAARPTFVDAWSAGWRALAPEMELLPLSREEMQALGAQIAGCRHWFRPVPATPLLALTRRLDGAIAKVGGRALVRLSSRSPKDAPRALLHGLCVESGVEALALILSGSTRCAADLRMALDADATMALVVRRWVDFPPEAEFRCFVRSRRWGAASHTAAVHDPVNRIAGPAVPAVLTLLGRGMRRWMAASHLNDAAIDWALVPETKGAADFADAVLLDVNPMLTVTDTGLFPDASGFDGTLRFRDAASGDIGRSPLPAATSEVGMDKTNHSSHFSVSAGHSAC